MESCDLVVFGAQGDLARRKLIPSLYQLEKADLIAPDTTIVGVARRESTAEGFLALARESLERFMKAPFDSTVWERFARRLRYAQIDLTQPDQYSRLQAEVDQERRATVNYLAVAPDLFGPICRGLAAAGLATDRARVVLEKPIGTDLASSRVINDAVGAIFPEPQVYRIDHYLGGQGCAPGILGVAIGGDRGSSYYASKEVLFRPMEDENANPELAKLEQRLTDEANQLGIGPMGFGGKTTVLATKMTGMHRLPASFFVSVTYMCWAHRRRKMIVRGAEVIYESSLTHRR